MPTNAVGFLEDSAACPVRHGRLNIREHHIDFVDAVTIFDGPSWERVDDREDYGEERWVAVGLMKRIEITVVFTDRRTPEAAVRWVISASRATRDEREAFHAGHDR
jgi:uncharacterized DUF497 family protein